MSTEPEAGERGGDEAGTGGRERGDRLVGTDVPRREDARYLTGRASYTDDLTAPDLAHLAFVRSDHGHARLAGVDTASAEAMDGVLGVYTWDDVEESPAPGVLPISDGHLDVDVPGHPVLATDRVRYQGQPIAVAVAEDRYTARDAVEAVEVDAEPLPAVVDPETAATDPDAPTIFEGAPDNVALTSTMGDADATAAAFADADRVVDLDLVNNRLIPSALEPRAALARWNEREDRLTVEMSSQSPHGHRRKLSHTLGLPERQVRVVSPDVGGGFGHKGHHHPGEAMAAWASMRLDRPVKWTATRSENYLAGAHGRDHVTSAALALDDDGSFRGLRAETYAGVGGYGIGGGPVLAGWYGRLLAGQYDIPAIHCETRTVFTNTAPVHSYRGAGRPEAGYVTERLVAMAARELDRDPAALRRQNQLDASAFPHETAVGASYDSGDYGAALDRALAAVDDDGLREQSGQRRVDGRYVGLGLACYVESTGGGFESGVVRVHPDGSVTVTAGTHSHGQGHETTYAQVVADELEIPAGDVDVFEGDTDRVPTGTGTFGSRSAITGGNAVAESARDVLAKARRVAAHELDCDLDEVAYGDGEFRVGGDPDRSVPWAEVASAAYGRGLPEHLSPGLEATTFYEPEGTAYTFGAHVAVVAVDPDTGEVDIERYVAVDDCGTRLNPTIIDGQVHGGVAQGLGQAMTEQAVYDGEGDLRTDTMLRYGIPRAGDVPDLETDHTVTPSPRNDLGVKGIGEAGTIAAPPVLVNAVVDALEPLGVDHVDMPLTEERVWRAIHGEE